MDDEFISFELTVCVRMAGATVRPYPFTPHSTALVRWFNSEWLTCSAYFYLLFAWISSCICIDAVDIEARALRLCIVQVSRATLSLTILSRPMGNRFDPPPLAAQ